MDRTDLNVKNLPDVIVGCDILHNVLPSQGKNNVQLLDIINYHETGEGELEDDEGKVFHRSTRILKSGMTVIWKKVCVAHLVFSLVHSMVLASKA